MQHNPEKRAFEGVVCETLSEVTDHELALYSVNWTIPDFVKLKKNQALSIYTLIFTTTGIAQIITETAHTLEQQTIWQGHTSFTPIPSFAEGLPDLEKMTPPTTSSALHFFPNDHAHALLAKSENTYRIEIGRARQGQPPQSIEIPETQFGKIVRFSLAVWASNITTQEDLPHQVHFNHLKAETPSQHLPLQWTQELNPNLKPFPQITGTQKVQIQKTSQIFTLNNLSASHFTSPGA
ncbi:MAG: hypothetical protein S4CHLAM102_05890 [Chlamydiia bacterium]|nr:hypothetical protein [Chlamydiia bacterium]